jgi:NAD-dependent SIR2 family protein deacetylase
MFDEEESRDNDTAETVRQFALKDARIAALVKERDEALKQASLLRGQLAGLQGQLAGTSCPNCGGRINPQTACCDECTEQDEKLCNDNSEQRARIAALEKALNTLIDLLEMYDRMTFELDPEEWRRQLVVAMDVARAVLAGGKDVK